MDYKSPTTPGLWVSFNNYVTELVCLNLRYDIGPRFWKDKKYWSLKYRLDAKGIHNLEKRFGSFDDPILRRAIVETIKTLNIQSLAAKKTLDKVEKCTRQEHKRMVEYRKKLAEEEPVISEEYVNTRFVDTNKKTKLARIKEIEKRGEEAKNREGKS